jgi:pSer/pThr/pTyr-binding forkhead associated (FHA) protein
MNATFKLEVITGPHRGQRFFIRSRNCYTLGRDPGCFVRLSGEERDRRISRVHCQIRVDGASIWVEDLGSRNGTYINGHEVPRNSQQFNNGSTERICDPESGVLTNGDVLTVGGTSLQLDLVEGVEAS